MKERERERETEIERERAERWGRRDSLSLSSHMIYHAPSLSSHVRIYILTNREVSTRERERERERESSVAGKI
jgi:hypothetical protein